jgi:hypothetical protein
MASPDAPRRLHLLRYEYVEDALAARAPHRAAHLEHIARWQADGRLVMAGATGDPPTGGAIVFDVADAADAEAFAAADPYVSEGVVVSWRVEPWLVVADQTAPD